MQSRVEASPDLKPAQNPKTPTHKPLSYLIGILNVSHKKELLGAPSGYFCWASAPALAPALVTCSVIIYLLVPGGTRDYTLNPNSPKP